MIQTIGSFKHKRFPDDMLNKPKARVVLIVDVTMGCQLLGDVSSSCKLDQCTISVDTI